MTEENTDRQPRTVAELLDRISQERAPLEDVVVRADDDALVASSGGWSAKDHLAHVAAWERRVLAEMQGDGEAAHFGLDASVTETDEINAVIYARFRDDSPAEVRAEFQAAGEAVRAAITELSQDDLARDVRPDDPLVNSLVDLIAWDTFKHYPQHAPVVSDLIGNA